MYRVRIVGSGWAGGPSLNTLYFTSGGYSAAGALDIVTHVRTVWYETLEYLYPPGFSHQISGEVDQLDPATGDIVNTYSVTPPTVMAGRGGAEVAPIVAAAVIRLTTALFLAGRRLRGRMFISPISQDKVGADGSMTTVAINLGNDFVSGLGPALTAGDAWVIWHRPVSGAGGVASQVTGGGMNDVIGELRSRRD